MPTGREVDSMRSSRARAGISIALVVGLSVVAFWTVAVGPTAALGSSPGHASAPLSAAEASLASGAGPAAGVPSTCTATTSSSASCSANQPSQIRGADTTGGEWLPVNYSRANTSLAYDARDGYVLAFGGRGPTGALGDTWKFGEGVWTLILPPVSPSARWGAAMTYDAASSSVVLFGGQNATTYFGDTWIFSGGIWTPLATSPSPSPRSFAAMAYDSYGNDSYTILFGGANGTSAFNDTWEYHNGGWTKLTTTGTPMPALQGSSLAYDNRIGYTVLFGGVGSAVYSSATYEYRSGVWSLGPIGPSARAFAGMAYDRSNAGKMMVLYGGCSGAGCSTVYADTWELINQTWTLASSSTSGLGARSGVALVFDGLHPDFYVVQWGGLHAATYVSDTWNLTASGWSRVAAGGHPPAVTDAVLVNVPNRNYVVLFGGRGALGATNATWLFAGGSWTLLCGGCGPSPRYNMSASYNPQVGGIVLFGGYSGGSLYHNDTWEFVNGTWSNVTAGLAPSARELAGMGYDGVPVQLTVLFGGYNGTSFLGDTWEFNGTTTTWSKVTPTPAPSPRADPTVTYDGPDAYLLLFGGHNASSAFNDTWGFRGYTNPASWLPIVTSPSPPARSGARADYGANNGYVVMFGGQNFAVHFNDTWGYIHGAWTNFAPPLAPPARSDAAYSYDRGDHYIVQFGGSGSSGTLADTWLWVAFNAQASASPNPTDVGIPVSFSVSAVAGVKPYSYSWSFGDGSNGTSATPTHTYLTAGTYVASVVVTDSATPLADQTSANVTVVVEPTLTVNATAQPSVAVPGYVVNFTANVSGGARPLSYGWSFGDGSVGATTANTSHAYAAVGTYNATLSVNDSAGVTVNRTVVVVVVSGLGAVVTVTPLTTDVGVAVAFNSTPIGGLAPYTYSWLFGDGTANASENTTHVYSTPGTYRAQFWVNDSAGHSYPENFSVHVNAKPSATLSALPSPVDVGVPVTFVGTAANGTPAFTYLWTFGDGGTALSANATHSYSSTGNFTVTFRATDRFGQSAAASGSVAVVRGPSVVAVATPSATEVGVAVRLDANTTGGVAPFSYAWQFGDGATGSGGIVSHAFASNGTFTVNVTVTDSLGLVGHGSINVTVSPPLSSSARATPSSVDEGVSVDFAATSSGGVAPVGYAWSFGDGTTGVGAAASHAFTAAGTYHAFLWANDSLGVSAVAETNVTVVANPSVSAFTVTPASVDSGASVSFAVTVVGGSAPFSFVYSGLPAGCTSVNSSSFACSPSQAGTYKIGVTVSDVFGHTANASVALSVTSTAGPTFLGLPQVEGYLVLAVVVAIVAALAAVAASRSRRRKTEEKGTDRRPPEEWKPKSSEAAPVESTPSEGTPPEGSSPPKDGDS